MWMWTLGLEPELGAVVTDDKMMPAGSGGGEVWSTGVGGCRV